MSIDWITVSAQIINFLILVWLLKRFLYKPILEAMAKREQHIASRLQEAQHREQLADQQAQAYNAKTTQLDNQRDAIMADAHKQADEQKHQLLEAARAEITTQQNHWQQQVEQEKSSFLNHLRHRTAGAVQTIARKALRDLADTDLEQQVIQRFIDQLAALPSDTRQALIPDDGPLQVNSAFELHSTQRERLTSALRQHLTPAVEVEFHSSPALLCGIELNGTGRVLRWSLEDYLDTLSDQVEKTFDSLSTPHSGREA